MNAKNNLTLLKALFFGLIAMCTISCDKDEVAPDDPVLTISDLVGSWHATSVLHTNNSDAKESFEMIENGGEVRITVLEHGGARTWVVIGPYSDEWDAQITITDDNTLKSTPVETSRRENTFTVELNDNVLTMTNLDSRFDFIGDGSLVSTTAVSIFEKQ